MKNLWRRQTFTYHATVASSPTTHTVSLLGWVIVGTKTSRAVLETSDKGEAWTAAKKQKRVARKDIMVGGIVLKGRNKITDNSFS